MTNQPLRSMIFPILCFAAPFFASPAMAQHLNDPKDASQHIDDVSKGVFRPGNAMAANQELASFCSEVNNKLAGNLNRAEWERVARYCKSKKREMEEYNPGNRPYNRGN